MSGQEDIHGCYASPPCFMHEVDPTYSGVQPVHADVLRWRKAKREEMIAKRMAMTAEDRAKQTERIAAGLDRIVGDASRRVVSLYWPFRGEPDLRGWMTEVSKRGAICALPVVMAKRQPLIFRLWTPGCRLERGVWNIPIPTDGPEIVPDIVIAPLVGFDAACYRLGYGGGFFDRTLAAMPGPRQAIGVGYASAALPTIYPQPHDIPMDVIITETEVIAFK